MADRLPLWRIFVFIVWPILVALLVGYMAWFTTQYRSNDGPFCDPAAPSGNSLCTDRFSLRYCLEVLAPSLAALALCLQIYTFKDRGLVLFMVHFLVAGIAGAMWLWQMALLFGDIFAANDGTTALARCSAPDACCNEAVRTSAPAGTCPAVPCSPIVTDSDLSVDGSCIAQLSIGSILLVGATLVDILVYPGAYSAWWQRRRVAKSE